MYRCSHLQQLLHLTEGQLLQISCSIPLDVWDDGLLRYIMNANSRQATHSKRLYKAMEKVGLESEAFAQLTTKYMQNTFNEKTPDLESVK